MQAKNVYILKLIFNLLHLYPLYLRNLNSLKATINFFTSLNHPSSFIQYQQNFQNQRHQMDNFPQDLNYGVALGEPQAKVGNGYNPPVVSNAVAANPTDEQAAQGSEKYDLKKAAHPTACVATFAFKAVAIFFYLIIGSIISSNIITFILVILFSSLDFWVVKNVTGRLLVGLRWWSQIDSKGKQNWRFQNPDLNRNTNRVDNAFFWTSQIAGTAIWAVFLLLKILTLSIFWSLLLLVCTSLCGTNLYAYYLCRGDHKNKVKDLKKKGIKMIFQNAMG